MWYMYDHPVQSPLISMTFHNVTVFQCCSLYFNTILAIRYTEVNYQLNKQSFYMDIKFDKLMNENDNVLHKKKFNLIMSA